MKNITVYYVYDALCGWCYGFSPVIKKLFEKYKAEISFEVLSGGMVMGERVGPISKMAPYILSAYKNVEERTGVIFGENFINVLKEGSTVFSSEKPGIAMTIFKELQPENAILFAADLQNALNYNGKDLNNITIYSDLVQKYEIGADSFLLKMDMEEYREKTLTEFDLVSQMGVNGFPTTFIKKDNQYYILARGFQNFENLDQKITELLN